MLLYNNMQATNLAPEMLFWFFTCFTRFVFVCLFNACCSGGSKQQKQVGNDVVDVYAEIDFVLIIVYRLSQKHIEAY